MLNIHELENRWRRYKIKSYIPYAVITISVITISGIIYFITDTKDEQNSTNLLKNNQTYQEAIIIPQSSQQKNVQVVSDVIIKQTSNHNDSKNVVLSPSLGFMSNIKHNNIYSEDANAPAYNNPIAKQKENKVIVQEPEDIEDEVIEESKSINKSVIKINRNNSENDLEYVIQRFKKSNNPALSLFIAKKYYSLGEYHKSYNYALITNELNGKVDASWIIFAKSLVKLNEKDEAIKTLKKYISHSHSNQAKILLDEIISGEFK